VGNPVESLKISSSKSQFDANAGNYANSNVHRFGQSLPVLLNLADPNKNDQVLDVATGTGNTALAFAPLVAKVTGLDMSPKMLEQAKTQVATEQIQNADFLEGDAQNLPFEDSSFSIVTSRHAPHHFHDVPKFLSEVARVLKPKGRFVMSDQIVIHEEDQNWVNEFQRIRDPSHFLQRLVTQWQDLMRDAGLVWIKDQLVPYKLEFDWWVQMGGCNPEQILQLEQMAFAAEPSRRNRLNLEFDADGRISSFIEPMLVVKLEKH
jgi:ubiquinone/menaquinone biosynthesis C-methylase UbiE